MKIFVYYEDEQIYHDLLKLLNDFSEEIEVTIYGSYSEVLYSIDIDTNFPDYLFFLVHNPMDAVPTLQALREKFFYLKSIVTYERRYKRYCADAMNAGAHDFFLLPLEKEKARLYTRLSLLYRYQKWQQDVRDKKIKIVQPKQPKIIKTLKDFARLIANRQGCYPILNEEETQFAKEHKLAIFYIEKGIDNISIRAEGAIDGCVSNNFAYITPFGFAPTGKKQNLVYTIFRPTPEYEYLIACHRPCEYFNIYTGPVLFSQGLVLQSEE